MCLQCFKGNTYCHGDDALNSQQKASKMSFKNGKEINITKKLIVA